MVAVDPALDWHIKRAGRIWPARLVCLEGLEKNLHSKLRVVRFARADARRTVFAADRLGACAKRSASAKVGIRLCQVCAVEDVEHLYAELCRHSFLVEGRVLYKRQIDISEAGSDDLVAAQIAVGGSCRHGKAILVEILRKRVLLH